MRRIFFTQRYRENWNGRGKTIVEVNKIGTFNKRLEKKRLKEK